MEAVFQEIIKRLALNVFGEHVFGEPFDAFFHLGLDWKQEIELGKSCDDIEVVRWDQLG